MPNMNKKFRRTISFDPVTYIWVRSYCNAENQAVSDYVTNLIKKDLQKKGVEPPTRKKAIEVITHGLVSRRRKKRVKSNPADFFAGVWEL